MRKNRLKHIGPISILIVLGVIVISSGLLFWRLHGGVVIKADETGVFTGNVTSYRQDDEKWADDRLGNSSFVMKSSGCLVTCIASAVSAERNEEITPKQLNQIFSEHNVYDSEGNIQWAVIENMDGYSVEVFDDVSRNEIDRCLESGHYPIMRVRVSGLGNFHYVLIAGIEDGDYICMDPLKSELTKLSHYLNRVYAVRLVYCTPDA